LAQRSVQRQNATADFIALRTRNGEEFSVRLPAQAGSE
jgi:hypothetical protein